MIVCGIDIETTGLDIEKDEITEIAWVIKRWGEKKPFVQCTKFCMIEGTVSEEITELTGITSEHLEHAYAIEDVLITLCRDIEAHSVDYLVGHNGKGFDRPWLDKAFASKMHEWEDCAASYAHRKWIDTKSDIQWKSRYTNLTYLAADHGFLNPFPHDALSDVMTMLKLLDTKDRDEVIRRALAKDIIVRAVVDYEDREMAKEKGYRWQEPGNGKTYTKKWVKSIKELEFDDERKNCVFPVEIIG